MFQNLLTELGFKKDFLSIRYCAKLIKSMNISAFKSGMINYINDEKFLKERIDNLLLRTDLKQEKSISEIYSKKFAVVRISTLQTALNKFEVVGNPTFRIEYDSCEDDFIIQRIHTMSGKLSGPMCYLKSGQVIKDSVHPDTNVCTKGFEIPYWQELKSLVLKGAEKMPEFNFLRWEVVLTEEGPFIKSITLDPKDFMDEQVLMLNERKHGIFTYYFLLNRYFKFCQRTNNYWIEQINSSLSFEDKEIEIAPDFVIVLGSNNCLYKAKKAVEKFSRFDNVIYIPSGANYSKNLFEYEVLNNELLASGIPASRIILEKNARITAENIAICSEIIFKYCSENNIKKPKVTFVTSWFHSKRIYKMAKSHEIMKNFDIDVVTAVGTYTKPDNWFVSFEGFFTLIREFYKTADKKLVKAFNKEF